ncbi:MAG TPA: hypothetical protein VFL14_04485 [Xanthomonadales bacterium]|nr:hypothetical protein [Xanthomonadales bacterium]
MNGMKRSLSIVAALAAASLASADPARDGVPDPRFGATGVASFSNIGTTGISVSGPRDIVEQPDGRLLVVGYGVRSTSNRQQPMVMRLLRDGSLDPTFGEQGVYLQTDAGFTQPDGGNASSAVVLDDGRIVVVGSLRSFDQFTNTGCTLVFALTAAGSPDLSWGPGPGPACLTFGRPFGTTSIPIGNVALAPDGGVYVNGLLGNGTGGTAVLARLDADGRFDTSYDGDGIVFFGSDFFAGSATHGLRSAADGSVWVLGGRPSGRSVAALDPTGQPVPAFGASGFATIDPYPGFADNDVDFDVDAAGRIALLSYTFEPGPINSAVVRFTATGQLDTGFNATGQQPGSPGVAMIAALGTNLPAGVRWRGGELVVVGGPGFTIASLLSDAAFDATFGDPSTPGRIALPLNTAWSTKVLADGDIVVAGSSPGITLLRLTRDGLLENGFE